MESPGVKEGFTDFCTSKGAYTKGDYAKVSPEDICYEAWGHVPTHQGTRVNDGTILLHHTSAPGSAAPTKIEFTPEHTRKSGQGQKAEA